MRNKVLRTIDLLMQQKPVRVADATGNEDCRPEALPQSGSSRRTCAGTQALAPVELPSIQPDKELDDMEIIARTVRQWAQKNFDKKDENPEGFRNVVLYYKMAVQYGVEAAARQNDETAGGSPRLQSGVSAKRE